MLGLVCKISISMVKAVSNISNSRFIQFARISLTTEDFTTRDLFVLDQTLDVV